MERATHGRSAKSGQRHGERLRWDATGFRSKTRGCCRSHYITSRFLYFVSPCLSSFSLSLFLHSLVFPILSVIGNERSLSLSLSLNSAKDWFVSEAKNMEVMVMTNYLHCPELAQPSNSSGNRPREIGDLVEIPANDSSILRRTGILKVK